jgi:hypothetical protein
MYHDLAVTCQCTPRKRCLEDNDDDAQLIFLVLCCFYNLITIIGRHCANHEDEEDVEASAAAGWSSQPIVATLQAKSTRHKGKLHEAKA